MDKYDTQKYNSHKPSKNVNKSILIKILYTVKAWIESGTRKNTEAMLDNLDIVIKDLKANQ